MSTRSLGTLTLDLVAKVGGFEQELDKAGRITDKRAKEIAANFGRLGTAIGVGFSAAAVGATALIRESLNSADELSKLSRSVGLTTEALSELKFAADLSGVEDLGGAINKFNKNIGEAALGTKDQADAFKTLGISVKDAAGNLRPTEDLLNDVADAFSGYADGAAKSTVAQKLFGRAGADLITFLDGGKKSISELREEAHKLGLTLTAEAAASAEQFNDNVDRVKFASEGLTNQITIGLAPTLKDLSNQFVAYTTTATNVEGATHLIDTSLKGLIVSGIAVKSAFVAIGSTIGGVLAASERAFQGVGASDALVPGKFIYHIAKNASATLDVLKDAYSDTRGKVSDDIEAIVNVINAGNKKIAEAQVSNGAAKPQLKLIDTSASSTKAAKAAKEQTDAVQKTIAALQEQVATLGLNERAQALYKASAEGATASQVAQINALYDSVDAFAAAQAQSDAYAARQKSNIKEEADAMAAAQGRVDGFLNADSFSSRADDIRKALGSIGDPVIGLVDAFSQLGKISEQSGKAMQDAFVAAGGDADKYKKLQDQITKQTVVAQIGAYGDLADSASQFFDKGSKGYKSLQAVSTVFHAAELAASIAELAVKGTSAVLTQGSGDPYTAFARMAAMAAIVAGLGVAIGGVGGGGSFSKPNSGIGAGKGTVLGDSDATSKSIGNSLDALVDLQGKGLFVAQSQLDALRAIQVGITGVGNLLYRTNVSAGGPTPFSDGGSSTTLSDGTVAFNHIRDVTHVVTSAIFGFVDKIPLIGSVFDALGGVGDTLTKAVFGSTKIKQIDSGLFIAEGQTLGDILGNGLEASYYATIKITKKKLFGLSKSSKTRDEFADLDDELSNQFTDIISGLGDSVIDAATMLGADAQKATDILNALPIDIGKISLDGLSSEDVQDKLNAVFSALGDTFASTVLPGIDDFQHAGEGLYETLIRVASQTAAFDHVLDAMGMSVGTLAGLDLAHIADNIIEASGGIDQFASNVSDFLQGFLSDSEQLQMQRQQLQDSLSSLGYALPISRDGFKGLVEGLDLTTDAGQQAYAALLAMSGQAAEFYDSIEDNYQSFVDAFGTDADKVAYESSQLSAALGGLGQVLPDSRAGFAALVNGIDRTTDAGEALYQALLSLTGQAGSYYDDLESAASKEQQAADQAQQAAAQAASAAVDKWRSLAKSLREFADSLIDKLVPATAAATANLQSQYDLLVQRARTGDSAAINQLPSAGNALADQLYKTAGTYTEYALGVASIRADALIAADAADAQADYYQKSLAGIAHSLALAADQLAATQNVADAIGDLASAQADYAAAQSAVAQSLSSQIDEIRTTINSDPQPGSVPQISYVAPPMPIAVTNATPGLSQEDIEGIRAEMKATAINTNKMAKLLDQVTTGGYSMKTEPA